MNFALPHAALAFWRTRSLARRLKTRADVEAWQAKRLERFLARHVPRVAFHARLDAKRLQDLPVIDKATVLANFSGLNRVGVTLEEARTALDAKQERVRGLIVGQSTGTSGNRGVFVISEAERFIWLGVILAKALPDALTTRHRVALVMPSSGQLYASANDSGRVALRFFDLGKGIEAWREDLVAFAPDAIVGPPKVLRLLAETSSIKPAHVFSGAEVLDPLDRGVIEAAWGGKVREIYMATEGLFGVACPHGVLHLAEDCGAFEFEKVEGSDLVSPLVTDFTRSTQIMARYRMNDLMRLSSEPCACGSPLQRVASLEGRQDDMFLLENLKNEWVHITPDVLRNLLVDSDRRIQDFRIVQTHANEVVAYLDAGLPQQALNNAWAALAAKFSELNVVPAITIEKGIPPSMDRKLRRVRRDWKGPSPPRRP